MISAPARESDTIDERDTIFKYASGMSSEKWVKRLGLGSGSSY